MKKCASCGRDNPDDALVCCYCGHEFAGDSSSISRDGEHCRYCGHPVEEWMISCPNCLKDLPSEGSVRSSSAWSTPSSSETGMESSGSVYPDGVHRADTTCSATPGESVKPLAACVLIIVAGLADMMSTVLTLLGVGELPDYPVEYTCLVNFCTVFPFLMGTIAVVAGVLALRNRAFAVVAVGAVAGMLGLGPLFSGFVLGLVGLILAAFSSEEFRR